MSVDKITPLSHSPVTPFALNSRFMKQVHYTVRALILRFIDLFYPPFRRFMPLQLFRYAACGGGNTLFNILIYYLCYHYALHEQVLDLGFYAFEPHTAAVFLAFC